MHYILAWVVMMIISTKGSEEVIRFDWEWRDGTECNVTHYPYVCTPVNWWNQGEIQDAYGCAAFYTADDTLRDTKCFVTCTFLCNNATLTTPRSYIYIDVPMTADSADSHCVQHYGTHLATVLTNADRASASAAYQDPQDHRRWMGLRKKWSVPLAKYECDPREEELYHEDAEDLSDWILDDDGTYSMYAEAYGYEDGSQCAVGSCYLFGDYVYDYQGLNNYLPSFVSPPISTLGYSEISLSFYIRPVESKTSVCTTSYSVDNATNYTLVHSATNPEVESLEIMFKVSQRLGADAANNNALRIRFQSDDNPLLNTRYPGCVVDEIVVCGFRPTMDPTTDPTVEPTYDPTTEPTAEPTTAIPTSSTTDPTTKEPTSQPTTEPTMDPTTDPTVQPTSDPTKEPTSQPTSHPTSQPITQSTSEPTEDYVSQSMDIYKQCMVAIVVAVGFATLHAFESI